MQSISSFSFVPHATQNPPRLRLSSLSARLDHSVCLLAMFPFVACLALAALCYQVCQARCCNFFMTGRCCHVFVALFFGHRNCSVKHLVCQTYGTLNAAESMLRAK